MKKFSKLLAVVLAIAVVICPMMSVVANATGTPSGTYKIETVSGSSTDLKLTIHSNDGFLVYQATVGFNSTSAFDATYSSNGYTNGLKVISYTLKSVEADEYNAPAISSQKDATSGAVTFLVQAADSENLDMYTEVVVGIRVASGSQASLTKVQAADDGAEITEDSSLLDFPAAGADGTIDTSSSEYNSADASSTAHVHNANNSTATEAYLKTAATCTAQAVYYKSCSVCGAASTDTFSSGEMAAHTPDHTKTNVKSPASCTADAVYWDECSVCHAQLTTYWTDTNSKLGHSMTEHAAQSASCTAAGNTLYYSCSRCNKYFGDNAGVNEVAENSWVLAKTAHTPSNTTKYVKTAATCKDDAVYYQECADCGVQLTGTWTDTGSHSSVAHTWGSYSSNGDATCTADGTKTRTCSVCSAQDTVTDTGSKIAHTFNQTTVKNDSTRVAAATCHTYAKYYKTCSCGAVSTADADIYEDTAAGYNASAHDGSLGAWQTNGTQHWQVWGCCQAEANKANHSGGTATCTAKAVCTVCSAEYGNKLDHTFTAESTSVRTAATCAAKQTNWYKCANCTAISDSLYYEVGEKAAHTWNYTSNSNGTHNATCTNACNCGETITNEACDTNGTAGACSKCGYTAQCQHTHKTVVSATAATETTDGSITFACSDCSTTLDPVTVTWRKSSTTATPSVGMGASTLINFRSKIANHAGITEGFIKTEHSFANGADTETNYDLTVAGANLTAESGYYRWALPVFTANFTDVFTTTFFTCINGSWTSGTVKQTSVQVLLGSVLSGTGNTVTKTVAANLLKMGAQAQADFAKQIAAADRADNILTGTNATYVTNTTPTVERTSTNWSPVLASNVNGKNQVAFITPTVLLSDMIGIKLTVNPKYYSGSLDNLTLHISYNDSNGVATQDVIEVSGYDASSRPQFIVGMNANNMRSAITVQVYSGDTAISPEAVYSIEGALQGSYTTYTALINSIMNYCDAVVAYVK